MIIESAIVTHSTTLGYGHHIWDFDSNKLDPLILPANVANTFLITGSVWSKTSFGLTLLRITDGWYRKFIWFCIITMNIAMFLSALFLWTSCTPIRKTWDTEVKGTCWDQKTSAYYNIFASGYSALMDFTLALLPCRFLWTLPIQTKEKVGAGLAMGMGVVAGIMAVIKTTNIPAVLSTDFGMFPLYSPNNRAPSPLQIQNKLTPHSRHRPPLVLGQRRDQFLYHRSQHPHAAGTRARRHLILPAKQQ